MNNKANNARPLLLALGAAALICGCSKTSNTADNSSANAGPAATTGQYIDDTAITAKVKSALMGDNSVKSADISVTTTQGVVTLSGTVDNSDQKAAAAKDASSVSGVKDVTNNLTTK